MQSAIDVVKALADDARSPRDRLAEVFARLLRLSDSGHESVREVADAAAGVADDGRLGLFAATARELASYYPGDPGVLAALLMHRLALQCYDAIFLAAGNLHAYLRGAGVEIMANSDNVMRGGLTPKFVNVDELLKVIDFAPSAPALVRPVEQSPGVWHYPAPAPEFSLWRIEVNGRPAEMPATELGRILLVTDGSVQVMSRAESLPLRRGESALVTVGERTRVTGSGTLFVGAPGLG